MQNIQMSKVCNNVTKKKKLKKSQMKCEWKILTTRREGVAIGGGLLAMAVTASSLGGLAQSLVVIGSGS